MNDNQLEQRVRAAIQAFPAPTPSEDQMEAIIARRLAGDRIALPGDPAPARSAVRRWAVILALGTAASLLAVTWPHFPRAGRRGAETLGDIGGVGSLYAQASDRPTFPVIRTTRPLSPGLWRYGMGWGWTSPLDSTESWVQELAVGSYEGTPAYRYRYGKHRGGALRLTDTLWLNRETLRPISREAGTAIGGHITQIFQDNAILTGLSTPGGMTTWHSAQLDSLGPVVKGIGRMPVDLYETAGPVALWRPQIAASLGAADLGPGWRGSMEALVAPLNSYGLRFWLNFEVVGEERVTVPAGIFDAWRIQVGKKPGFYAWVSKDQQWLLQLGAENSTRGARQVLLGAEAGTNR